MTNKAYLSTITVTDISQSFTYNKTAAKINWHRYGTKLRHCDAMYTWGEVTSQNLWPRYGRHFVGITWHNVRS